MKSYVILLLFVVFAGCTGGKSRTGAADSPGVAAASVNDSADQIALLKKVYQWHATDRGIDFDLIVKDSFQTGLNFDSFNRRVALLQATPYFSSSFLGNYKKIGEAVNKKLTTAHPPLLNEINFDFQDADPWTWFQDELPNFWDSLTITDYHAGADSASLKWLVKTKDWSSEAYRVRFQKEAGAWKVAWLEGFDPAKY